MLAVRRLAIARPWACAPSIDTRRYLQSSTAQAAPSADGESQAAEDAPKKRYKRKTLAEVAAYLPENGMGARFTRLMWLRNGYDESYWTITRVDKREDGKMRFYGRLTFRGEEKPYDTRVKPANKRDWRFIRDEPIQ